MNEFLKLFNEIEPAARKRIAIALEADSNSLVSFVTTDAVQHSMAISLKRIADTLAQIEMNTRCNS